MTGPAPFLDFFVLEAGEYIEQIDALLLVGGPLGPDAETMQRLARALRGSATMAKIGTFADVASGVERIARALRDGSLPWDPSIGGVLVAAVDDLKLMLRNARHWTPADDERAKARTAELSRHAPLPVAGGAAAAGTAGSSGSGGVTFLAGEATNIAAGVELLATRPDDRQTAVQVLKRVRALRGIAGVKEVEGLADVLDTTEDAAKGLERGDGPLSSPGEEVLRAAAVLLRKIAAELREGQAGHPAGPERAAFAAAVDHWFERDVAAEPIVPIAELYYADSGPHVVSTSHNPPTSSTERFRLELVSLVEHLRGLLLAAYGETEEPTARVRREFLRALRGIASVVHSFGDRESGELVNGIAAEVASGAPLDLARINAVADALDEVGEHADRLRTRLTVEARARPTGQMPRVQTPEGSASAIPPTPVAATTPVTPAAAIAAETIVIPVTPVTPITPVAPVAAIVPETVEIPAAPVAAKGPETIEIPETPVAATTPVTPEAAITPVTSMAAIAPEPAPTATTRVSAMAPVAALDEPEESAAPSPTQQADVHRRTSEIDAGVAAIERLNEYPLADATVGPQSEIVPIDTLLYRGRGALTRAIEIRDELRSAGGTFGAAPQAADALDELFDLLDLAMAE